MEVDLSAGLPDQITLNWNSKSWVQNIDYENTAFRCRLCQQTGHLQGSCPMDRRPIKGKLKTRKKNWDSPDADEEVDFEEEDEGVVQNGEEKEPKVVVHHNRKDEICGEEQNKTSTQEDYDALDHTDPTLGGVK